MLVRTQLLDQLVRDHGFAPDRVNLSFVKLDCEGGEPLLLTGAREVLRRFRPILCVEVNRASLRAAGAALEAIQGTLRSLNYELHPACLTRHGIRRAFELLRLASLDIPAADCFDVVAVHPDRRDLVEQWLKRNSGHDTREAGPFL